MADVLRGGPGDHARVWTSSWNPMSAAMEYAVEMIRLIELQLEVSIG